MVNVFKGPRGGMIIGAMVLTVVFTVGTFGFAKLEDWSLFDSLYMTIISITTVGYGEVHDLSKAGRVLATFVIVAGIGSGFFITTMLGRIILDAEFHGKMMRRNMKRTIERLKGHTIICGHGRMGSVVAETLQADGHPFVVVETEREGEDALKELGYPYVVGDATDEQSLLDAGVERATHLLSLLSSDADNLYLTIMAKEMNPRIHVVARALDDTSERRLRRGGADAVVAPYRIGAHRVIQAALRPTVNDFIDLVHSRDQLSLILEEIRINEDSHLIGKSLADTGLRGTYRVIIVTVKRRNGEMVFNPDPSLTIERGDILIALGEEKGLKALSTECEKKVGV